MPNYRRAYVSGGCWFFTVTLLDRRSNLLVEEVDALREAVRATHDKYPFHIDAMVILPDHLHAVWTLPQDDFDFSVRWRLIKWRFVRAVPASESTSAGQRKHGIWQSRFWEHLIRNHTDYARHIEYCYINPVKHGLVRRVQDWPHSSFHRDVRAGIFALDWAGEAEPRGDFGERD